MRHRRKRCPFCTQLFWPDTRTAARQWSCTKSSCQQARRKETQRRYRALHPTDAAARRLRDAITEAKAAKTPLGPRSTDPISSFSSRVPRDELRDEISPDIRVLIEFFVRLVTGSLRDEMRAQRVAIAGQMADFAARLAKDESAPPPAPP